jgi:uncharacterized membrane protein
VVDLKPLWKVAATNRQNYLVGDVGIRCGNCGTRLRIVQDPAKWGSFVGFFVVLITGNELSDYMQDAGILGKNLALAFVLVFLVIIAAVLGRAAPRLVTLRLAGELDKLEYPLERNGI